MKNYKDINKFKASVLDSVKEELSKLSPIKRWLFETLFDKIWAIFSDECSETEISSAINSLEKVNSEYVRPTDVLNYDESMRVLNFSNNRVDLSVSWMLKELSKLFLRIVRLVIASPKS